MAGDRAQPRVAFATAAGPDELAALAVLGGTVAEHHAGATLLAVAPTASGPVPGVDLVEPDDLAAVGVPRLELHRRAAFSRPFELLASLKPALLRLALDRGAEVAVWLDPAVELHGDLDPLVALAHAEGVALVPTTTSPLPDDDRLLDDASLLTTGLVSTSILGVGRAGEGLLDWWSARAARSCLLDPPDNLLLDRRWLEAALVLFDAPQLRDPGVGVGYVNLHERPLATAGGVHEVDGRPLRAFDFSGLDPASPWLLSVHQGDRPRTLLSERPVLAGLVAGRVERLVAAEASLPPAVEWPYAVSACGLPVDDRQRHTYRRELRRAEAAGTEPPPDPFDLADPEAYRRWWAQPVGGTAEAPRNRWGELLLAERVDLRVSFPEPDGGSAVPFYEWVRSDGVAQGAVPDGLVPQGTAPLARPEPLPGVNVIGFLDLERGVGQAARAVAGAVEAAGYPVHRLDLPDPGAPPGARPLHVEPGPYDLNLLSVNPNEVVLLDRSAAHRRVLEGRRNVALWFWEVDRLPPFMQPALSVVDEIWVASRYDAELFRGWTDRPVEVFPHPVAPALPTHLTRDDLGLPPGFLFAFAFDHLSLLERKNPIGLVDAYTRAFGPDDGTVLVVKTINGEQRPIDVERLRMAVADRPDVVVLDRRLSAVEMRAFYGLVDAYVSLHRSEGFGQTMADAMAHAKPVIATGFSANLDYMHADNGYLVSWRPVPVGEGSWPYPPDATWADPDLDEAASWMRHVVEHPEEAAAKGERARQDVLERYSTARAAQFVTDRMEGWLS